MWEKVEVTYEGTTKVKETRIKLLIQDYELFQMKEGESIEEMCLIFNKIIGDLNHLGDHRKAENRSGKFSGAYLLHGSLGHCLRMPRS